MSLSNTTDLPNWGFARAEINTGIETRKDRDFGKISEGQARTQQFSVCPETDRKRGQKKGIFVFVPLFLSVLGHHTPSYPREDKRTFLRRIAGKNCTEPANRPKQEQVVQVTGR